MRMVLAAAITLTLVGCAQHRIEISRFDGAQPDPVQLEQTKTACTAKAEVETMQVPHKIFGDGYGIGRAMEQEHVRKASFQGCMADKGMRVVWVKDSGETASISPLK